jgi:hypothetical protein
VDERTYEIRRVEVDDGGVEEDECAALEGGLGHDSPALAPLLQVPALEPPFLHNIAQVAHGCVVLCWWVCDQSNAGRINTHVS